MVCLVTGSSRGLGKAIALAFARKGDRVAVHYKDKRDEACEVSSLIRESVALKADVRNPGDVIALVEEVIHRWERIDVLVNNAGITIEKLLVNTSEREFEDVVNANLRGPFHFIRAAGKYMIGQQGGHIINVSSYAGMKGKKGLAAYSASKAGLIGLTKTAAREFAEYNIMVNAVLPGYMLTDMGVASSDRGKEKALNENLIREFADPQRVAEFICHLSETKGITGQVFNLDSRVI